LFELVAVAGSAATADVLMTILGDDWHRPLRGLLQGRLLLEHPTAGGVAYEVAHPLYAEVAYAGLTLIERRRTHAAIEGALEVLRPEDVVALAPHCQGAAGLVDPHRSLAVLAAAGQRALVLHADAEACQYLGEATAHAEGCGSTEMLPSLWEALGTARERCGDLEGAVAVWQSALEASIGVDPSATPRLHNRLALLEWERGNLELSRQHLREVAAEEPREGGLEQLLLWLIVTARSGDADVIRAFEHVESLAKRLPSASAEAVGHITRASVAQIRRDYPLARAEGERALALLDESDPVYLVGGPHRQICLAATAAGDVRAGIAHARLAVAAAHEGGLSSIECASRINLAVAQFLAGDWDAAASELEQAVRLGRRAMSPRAVAAALVWQGFLRAHRGALESARTCLMAAERSYPRTADQHIHGDLTVVRATLDHIAGRRPEVFGVQIPPTGARYALALPLLGEALLAAGDRDGAEAIVAQLHHTVGSPPLPQAFADRLDGLLCGDAVALGRAQHGFNQLGMPFEEARATLERSELAMDVDGLTAAALIFDRLGAKPWSDRSRRLLRSRGVLRTTAPRGDGVLSAREAEVARLAAEGMSNAEIAARLYLGVRTVETHLHKAYVRLGLGSRVALARWVAEQSDGR
jgi:DNA-binding CsgD family transcriptional regulator/tetratricopeptide (TPR) repeat protein